MCYIPVTPASRSLDLLPSTSSSGLYQTEGLGHRGNSISVEKMELKPKYKLLELKCVCVCGHMFAYMGMVGKMPRQFCDRCRHLKKLVADQKYSGTRKLKIKMDLEKAAAAPKRVIKPDYAKVGAYLEKLGPAKPEARPPGP